MKLIIAGSRTVSSVELVSYVLDRDVTSINQVVSGVATGADTSGEYWALNHNIPIKRFYAQWKTLGKSAGPIRNQQMGDYADGAIIFWDGQSRGSMHMHNYMLKLGKPSRIIEVEMRRDVNDRIFYVYDGRTFSMKNLAVNSKLAVVLPN